MKISSLSISNFRGYKNKTVIPIKDITVFIGRNDIGKSTILEALDIFLNDNSGTVKIDKKDKNTFSDSEEIEICVEFEDLPDKILIDSDVYTSLKDEYMLNKNNNLEIIKRYKISSGKLTSSVFIKAIHPTNPKCQNLLNRKISDLKQIAKDNHIECSNLSVSSLIRADIWNHFKDELQLEEVEIEANKEEMKKIWPGIQKHLPIYFLFQADRQNKDNDTEVQDPLKTAVRELFQDEEIQEYCNKISEKVINSLNLVSRHTLEKLREIDPNVANKLAPQIPDKNVLKWEDVFKNVSIEGDDNIPINKRGSGVKRLILFSFFRAKAETKMEALNNSVIYAIEEPETSQHAHNQQLLIESLKSLSKNKNTQVILTTHSSILAKNLNFDDILLITENEAENNSKQISKVVPKILPYPSLSEVSYSIYGDCIEEYHNELYGYIESTFLRDEYNSYSFSVGKIKPYILIILDKKEKKQKLQEPKDISLSEYIRHKIHHPENKENTMYSPDEICLSISMMQEFILSHKIDY